MYKDLTTTNNYAKLKGVTTECVRQWALQGKIKSVKIDGVRFIKLNEDEESNNYHELGEQLADEYAKEKSRQYHKTESYNNWQKQTAMFSGVDIEEAYLEGFNKAISLIKKEGGEL